MLKMMKKQGYSIQEICEQTGIPRRTIHFYTQQGILPPPESSGIAARYSEEHLIRLKAIPRLRNQGLRLDDIRKYFSNHALETIRKICESGENQSESVSARIPAKIRLQYDLPHGISISAPQNLTTTQKKKLEELISEANRIFKP